MAKKLVMHTEKNRIKTSPNDSGWRFFAGTEDDAYLKNSNNFNVFELNTICNYDEIILPILESKIGTSFIRAGDVMIKDENKR